MATTKSTKPVAENTDAVLTTNAATTQNDLTNSNVAESALKVESKQNEASANEWVTIQDWAIVEDKPQLSSADEKTVQAKNDVTAPGLYKPANMTKEELDKSIKDAAK